MCFYRYDDDTWSLRKGNFLEYLKPKSLLHGWATKNLGMQELCKWTAFSAPLKPVLSDTDFVDRKYMNLMHQIVFIILFQTIKF